VTLLLLSLRCNLVCVRSIPGWKFRISTGVITNATAMRLELSLTAWVGVVVFVSGLTLAYIGNVPA
jgi:hypothetical protein